MKSRKAVFILNPSSGQEQAESYRDMCTHVLERMGYTVSVRITEKEGDATVFARDAAMDGCALIVAMGGDGTVNETINGVAGQKHRPPLALIPLGTVNDLARALEIPLDPEEAIERLPEFVERPTDIGMANDRYFMNILAIGSLAEGVMNVPVEEKTRFGSVAYVAHGLQTILSDEGGRFVITHDGGKWSGQASLILAAMTKSTGGFNQINPEARPDDGLIHLILIKHMKLPDLLGMSAALLFGKLQEHGAVHTIRTTYARIETDGQFTCNIDGDEGGETPVELRVLRCHLKILAPEIKKGE